jgi:hypothetical protein
MWEHRKNLGGFAHSHPGSGVPTPSYEDVTTFSAIERGLGQRLFWYITSSDSLALYTYQQVGPDLHEYKGGHTLLEPVWLPQLRHFSNYYNQPQEGSHDDSTDDNNQR